MACNFLPIFFFCEYQTLQRRGYLSPNICNNPLKNVILIYQSFNYTRLNVVRQRQFYCVINQTFSFYIFFVLKIFSLT